MKTTLSLVGLGLGAALGVWAAVPSSGTDPFLWLEQAHSERAMKWVEAENAKTDSVLERDPRFQALFRDAKIILEAKDRIPEPSAIGGRILNFWQDACPTFTSRS